MVSHGPGRHSIVHPMVCPYVASQAKGWGMYLIWQGATAHGPITVTAHCPITEVKQLWAWLVLGWVTLWDTLVVLRCDWNLLCCAMAYYVWAYKRFPECFPTHKKAGVCAVMPMWLVHIKEHVWTVGTCLTTTLLSAMSECVNECCIERPNKNEIWDGRPVCSPGSWSGRVWLPLKKSGMTVWKSGLSRKM